MGKPNFGFQKRQKELARQKKQEEKRQRKLDKADNSHGVREETASGDSQPESIPGAQEPGS